MVGVLGARQVGKTTLARMIRREWEGASHWFDLEDPGDRRRLDEPMLALKDLEGLVVIDEIQRSPGLFEVLRVLVDRRSTSDHTRFLVLGSASPELLRQGSETLAGRIAYHVLEGFHLDEVGVASRDGLWLRGGFPRAFLAADERASLRWRHQFADTFLQRDLPQLGITIPSETLRRFWTMLAHYHGQIWNASEFARAFGIAATTVRRYLDLLASAYVVRLMQPWRENLRKRQVRAPKVYLADSGLLHSLLGLRNREELDAHVKVGASWEGFVLGEIVHHLGARTGECFFWATHAGAELDLLVIRGNQRRGFEVKRTMAPRRTRSMLVALEDLRLDSLDVIHAGEHIFPMGDRLRALPLARLHEGVAPLS